MGSTSNKQGATMTNEEFPKIMREHKAPPAKNERVIINNFDGHFMTEDDNGTCNAYIGNCSQHVGELYKPEEIKP
jgi:hypothetical protein